MARQILAVLLFPLALSLWIALRIGLYWSLDGKSFFGPYRVEVSVIMLAMPALAVLITALICRRFSRPVVGAIIGESLIYVLNAGLFLKLFFI